MEPSSYTRPPSWRDAKWLAFAEFAIVLGIFFADNYHLIPFSKTPFLALLGWISLRLRNLHWKDAGLVRYGTWAVTLALGTACGIGLELFDLFGKQPLLVHLLGKQPDLSLFQPLTGNMKLTLLGLVLAWTLAAFGEEFVYRGYLMDRVAGLVSNPRVAWTVSLLLVSALFGFAHDYQGITGIVEEGSDGVLLGLMYLGCRRSLAVPIIAHGVCDTIDLLLIFLGKYPGM